MLKTRRSSRSKEPHMVQEELESNSKVPQTKPGRRALKSGSKCSQKQKEETPVNGKRMDNGVYSEQSDKISKKREVKKKTAFDVERNADEKCKTTVQDEADAESCMQTKKSKNKAEVEKMTKLSESVKRVKNTKKGIDKMKSEKMKGTEIRENKDCEFVKDQNVSDKFLLDLEITKKKSQADVTVKNKQTKDNKPMKGSLKSKGTKTERQDNRTKSALQKEYSELEQVLDSEEASVDEIDGDKATSEYFSSDSNVEISHIHNKRRKRKSEDNKKSMSAKVKLLQLSTPLHSNVQTLKPKVNSSSDSDFEEVQDIKSVPLSNKISTKLDKMPHSGVETCSSELILSPTRHKEPVRHVFDIKIRKEKKECVIKPVKKRKSIDANITAVEKSSSKKMKNEKKPDYKGTKYRDVAKDQDSDQIKSKIKTEMTVSDDRKRKKSLETTEMKTKKRKQKQDPVKSNSETMGMKTKRKQQKQELVQSHPQSLESVDQSDITALLLHMEGPGALVQPSTSYSNDDEIISDDDDSDEGNESDESENEWEDVEDHHGNSPVKSQVPDKPVEITLEAPVIYKKRKKREFDIKAYFQRQINKYKRELNISMHKVHLLCLLSRGFYLNNVCLDETLEAQAMSISMATRELNIASVKSCDISGLSYMVTWMKKAFPLKISGEDHSDDMKKRLEKSFQQRCVTGRLEFVLVCVILLRQLGFLTRLIMSLQPIPIKTAAKKDTNSQKKRSGNPAKISKPKKMDSLEDNKTKKGDRTSGNSKSKEKPKTESDKRDKPKRGANKNKANKVHEDTKKTKPGKEVLKKRTSKKVKEEDNLISDSEEEVGDNQLRTKNKLRRSCASKIKASTYIDGEDEVDDSADEFVPVENDSDESHDSDNNQTEKAKRKTSGTVRKEIRLKEDIESSDGDFAEESFQVRTEALKKVSPASKNKKVLSSDSGELGDNNHGADEWVEVFLQKEQKWVCIDCVTCKLNKPYSVEHNATPPVHYVVGFSEDGTVKDVTARYASQWLTNTRKFRSDEDWWTETLDYYKSADRKMDEREEREIQSHLLQRPLPTSVAAFKNHPLYVLKRHLLKFEAIYPDTAVPLGYIRGEPVYARECVHVLHSRENWLKEGRAVRVGEEPYKHVKSRPKWNKPKENPDALDLEVFGRWQTEVYIPPPAVDGKVPRNAHGNVELFLPSMLPAGTVHLQIPGLNRVAKKLDIDCAPAMVGWEHHCGFSHPLMDGWIVCEEFKDILLAAWDEEQEIIREKEQEKREKRVYANWKLLIKGALIKERLKKRFDLEDDDKSSSIVNTSVDTKAIENSEKAADYTKSWPQNRQTHEKKHFDVEKL